MHARSHSAALRRCWDGRIAVRSDQPLRPLRLRVLAQAPSGSGGGKAGAATADERPAQDASRRARSTRPRPLAATAAAVPTAPEVQKRAARGSAQAPAKPPNGSAAAGSRSGTPPGPPVACRQSQAAALEHPAAEAEQSTEGAPSVSQPAQPQPSSGAVAGIAPASSTQATAAATAPPPADAAAALQADVHPPGEPFSVIERAPLAGGTLELVRLEGERLLRVWMPPGYCREEAGRHLYPLLLLNDGQNLFDDSLSFSGCSWRAADTAAQLIAAGDVPPFLICGIDHAGANRSFDYLPYKPGTGPGGFRKDAADWPGGGVAAYLDRVFGEILPWVQATYGAASDPALIAFGGSSFGGICTLYACMHHGDKFGAALVESPSLWFADERFLREDLPAYDGPWPDRLFLAMGSREYGGISSKDLEQQEAVRKWDRQLVRYCEELAELPQLKGLDEGSTLQWQVAEGAAHTESAWAERLPGALRFLLGPWWRPVAARNAGALFFTSPRRLQAGQPGLLFVQKGRSHILAGQPGPLMARFGFNNWSLAPGEAQLRPAPQLGSAGSAGDEEAWQATAAADGLAAGSSGLAEGAGSAEWQCMAFTVPERAWEMQFVLTDGRGSWDNNAGADFYVRIKLPAAGPASSQAPEDAIAAAAAAAEGCAAEIAGRSASRLFFTTPEVLVAGAPARMYFNRARSWPLSHHPNIKVHLGFNHWELPAQDQQLTPTSLWRGEGVDWWATPAFQVPEVAFELSFCFTGGHDAYDSNDGLNYTVPVWSPMQQQAAPPRSIASTEVIDHAGGKLHIITLTKRAGSGKAAKEARWTEERTLRVWTPPGYSREGAPPGGWPVLWMCDGSNKFEDWLAHQGHAWNVGHCAAGLIDSGAVPPFVVAAVDSAGPMRSLNYLPYKPGTGLGGFRGDAERWPGGGCEGYMRRLTTELMPLVCHTFATATDPARVAFGGGSFAGVTALYAAMHYPHVFGAVLAESPSLWIAEGRFLQDMREYRGALPERVFIGCGTKEYSATRDHERDDVDQLLLHYYHEAAHALEAAGMRGPGRLRFLVEEGAGHHEKAWAWRLSGALAFLLGPWRDG